MSEHKESEIVFFLGAGASVKAGVPDTFGLVDKFKEKIKDQPSNLEALEKILEILKQLRIKQGDKEGNVDIELLLETIERLEHRDRDVLLKFHKIAGYELSGYVDKKPLKDELKDFIKSVGIVEKKDVIFLEPLLGFMVDNKPLDIFSVNYDICIEQFCSAYRKQYIDGFDIGWNPKRFVREDIDVRLYKLHGSIMWYRTDTGDYIKIPIKSGKAQTELITGERAETLILYPIRKWEYAEPLLELLIELKKKLEKAKFVIVVGYSFRDDHIRRIFWDSARKNREMILVLIGPNSNKIYHERLKHYEKPEKEYTRPENDEAFLSELSNRTICLPYKFEDVFPILRNYFLRSMRNGLTWEENVRKSELAGIMPEKQNIVYALTSLIDCNHMEKVEEFLPKVNLPWLFKENIQVAIECSIKCIINYASIESYDKSELWFKRLRAYLTHSQLYADLSTYPLIKAGFKLTESSPIFFNPIADHLRNTLSNIKSLSDKMVKERANRIKPMLDALEQLDSYFQTWAKERVVGIEYLHYKSLRKSKYPKQIRNFERNWAVYKNKQSNALYERVASIIEEIEHKEIESIFLHC